MQESRNRELRTIRSGLQDQFAGGRAELHMKVARFLAKAHRKGGLDSRTATLVRRGIVRACDIAFGLRPPSGTEMDFYSQWTSRPPHLGAMDLGSPADFLSFMFPEGAIDSEPDLDPVRGTNLLIEQVRETFGFGHMSDFTGRTAGDRPIEVVETYKRLTERFVDTLRADGEGITRSNIIRELDAAYENDDLVSLLQIEVENLGGDPGFLVGMDDARLKLTIMAIVIEGTSYLDLLADMEKDDGYADFRLFRSLGGEMDSFRQSIMGNLLARRRSEAELGEILAKATAGDAGKIRTLASAVLRGKGKMP